MTIETYELEVLALDQSNEPIEGARVVAKLDRADFTSAGGVFPVKTEEATDSSGVAVLTLVSNMDGTQDSRYDIQIYSPGGSLLFSYPGVQMPRANTTLQQIIESPEQVVSLSGAAISADLAESWAEGTEPGGEGTKSAREWAEEAEGSAEEAAETVDAAIGLHREEDVHNEPQPPQEHGADDHDATVPAISADNTWTGKQSFTNDADATSPTDDSASVHTAGGLAVEKSIQVGGPIRQVQGNNAISVGEGAASVGASVCIGLNSGDGGVGTDKVLVGVFAGRESAGSRVVAVGREASDGMTGADATHIGTRAGKDLIGDNTVCIGEQSGLRASLANTVYIGVNSGRDASNASHSVIIGRAAGIDSTGGGRQVFIGNESGLGNTGASCIFVGNEAGKNNTAPNRFELAQRHVNTTPLMEGDFAAGTVSVPGSNDATSPTDDSAALHTAGGLAVEKSARFGGSIEAPAIQLAQNARKELAITAQVTGTLNTGDRLRYRLRSGVGNRNHFLHVRFVGRRSAGGDAVSIDKLFVLTMRETELVSVSSDTRLAQRLVDGEVFLEHTGANYEIDLIIQHPSATSQFINPYVTHLEVVAGDHTAAAEWELLDAVNESIPT